MGGRVGETLAAAAAVGSCSCYESVLHSVPAQQLNSDGQQATGAGGSPITALEWWWDSQGMQHLLAEGWDLISI